MFPQLPDYSKDFLIEAAALSFMVISLIGIWFYIRQNRNQRLGGSVAAAKMLWLCMLVYLYFFFPLWVLFFNATPDWLESFCLVFLGLFIVRGLVEVWALYIIKKWSPTWGIGHNIFMFLLTLATLVYSFLQEAVQLWVSGFLLILAFALLTDTVYARWFRRAYSDPVNGRVDRWFVSSDAHDQRMNLTLTRITNVILILALGYLIILMPEP